MSTKNGSSKAPTAPQEPAKQRPAHEIRLGRIKATIWANQSDNGTWYNANLSRSYKDGDEWKSSTSFGRDELLTVAKVAESGEQLDPRPGTGAGEQRPRKRATGRRDPVLIRELSMPHGPGTIAQ